MEADIALAVAVSAGLVVIAVASLVVAVAVTVSARATLRAAQSLAGIEAVFLDDYSDDADGDDTDDAAEYDDGTEDDGPAWTWRVPLALTHVRSDSGNVYYVPEYRWPGPPSSPSR